MAERLAGEKGIEMATIETKYSVGDVVWFANTTTEGRQHPCPDCKGTRKWKGVAPSGNEYTFSCPRCSTSYQSNRELSLVYTAHTPIARKLTIGSVKYDSTPWREDECKATYMCLETGVGSGNVYREDHLFEIEQDALVAAQVMADLANSEVEWIATLYNKTLEMSDYQLDSALIQTAKEKNSRASSMLWNLNALFEKINEAEDKDEILEAIEDYKKYDWSRDKEKAAA